MNGRRAAIALCALCVTGASTLAAQSAAAAGTTGVTCVEVKWLGGQTSGFKDKACGEPTEVPENVHYEHRTHSIDVDWDLIFKAVEIILKSAPLGINLEVTANKASGSGTLINTESGGEMLASGTGTVTYEEATVIAPAGKGCEVEGGKIVTNKLKFTTAGQGDNLKFEPASGSVLATFKIKGCATSGLNKEYKLEGSFKGTPKGTSIVLAHAGVTEQGTLTLGGQKAGISGALELEGMTAEDSLYTPVAFTT